MKNYQLGQSLIEVVFAIGVMALVLSGLIALLVTSLKTRTVGFDRSKATRLGETVVEDLVSKRQNDAVSFWQLTTQTNQQWPGYNGYLYSVGYTVVSGASYPGCNQKVGVTDCAEANITIGWSGSNVGGSLPQINMVRFFSRK